jgi:hypothetical protein
MSDDIGRGIKDRNLIKERFIDKSRMLSQTMIFRLKKKIKNHLMTIIA